MCDCHDNDLNITYFENNVSTLAYDKHVLI